MAVNATKLPSGTWRAQLYIGKDATGKRKYKSFPAPTKREAERAAMEYRAQNDRSDQNDVLSMTVGEAIDRYIALKEGAASPSTTLGDKRKRKNCYGYANIENEKLRGLTASKLQKWISDFSKSGKSPKYIRNAYGLLHASISMFMPEFNPRVQLPQKLEKEILIPTEDEVRVIYASIKGTNLELPFLLASQCGLRASEIAGLRKVDVDSKKCVIYIRQARVTGENGATIKAPKTNAGYRYLPCEKRICDLCHKSPGEYVTTMNANQISTAWAHYVDRNKDVCPRRVSFHALRHYFASVGLLLGIPKPYLVRIMGHSSSRMIDKVYGHLFPVESERYANLLHARTASLLEAPIDATQKTT